MWVIDFEASGLSRLSYPISVGVTSGETEFYALIRPMPHWTYWSKEAEQVHLIERNMLFNQGQSADVVARSLNSLLDGQIVYCDASKWDRFWVNILFSDSGIHQNFELHELTDLIDTDAQLETFLDKKFQLVASDQYRLHHALDDARIILRSLMAAFMEK